MFGTILILAVTYRNNHGEYNFISRHLWSVLKSNGYAELVVNQVFRHDSVLSSVEKFRKILMKVWNRYTPVFSNKLVNLVNHVFNHYRFAPLVHFVVHICASVFKLSTPIKYQIITRNCITVNSTRWIWAAPFLLDCKKTNYTSHLTDGRR